MTDIVEVAEGLNRHRELSVLQLLAPFKNPILIAGAYKGDTIKAIRQLDTNVEIHAFEPQKWCHEYLQELVDAEEKERLTVHKVAIGKYTGEAVLHRVGSDFASLVDESREDEQSETIEIREAENYLRNTIGVNKWDLLLLNMEGYEYKLLPHLEMRSLLQDFKNILVQCHPKVASVEGPPLVHHRFALMWDYYPKWLWYSQSWSIRQ